MIRAALPLLAALALSACGDAATNDSAAAIAEPTQPAQAGAGLSGPPSAIVSAPLSVPCSTAGTAAANPPSGASPALHCAP